MTYLLDTHYLLWCIADTKKISAELRNVITAQENTIIVSAISFWEISLKAALGKLHLVNLLPEELPAICTRMGFKVQPVSPGICSTYHQLTAAYHRDPFDRMLIWEAISNNYILITKDATIKKYMTEGLLVYKKK